VTLNGVDPGSSTGGDCYTESEYSARARGEEMPDNIDENDSILMGEAQLILAEERTSLALMRTGIAVLALPMSVMSVLVATSKLYDVVHVMHILVPLSVLILALLALGIYLIIHAIIQFRYYDKMIYKIKSDSSIAEKLVD
jgi:uncharacterized membrane protein YidH (DUF202 family)